MPKVVLLPENRKAEEFSEWILGKMRFNHVKQSDLAEYLGITQPAINQKIHKSSFTLKETFKIFHYFNADDETILRIMRY